MTEGGFGADLGAEKFFNIKCRQAGLTPACAVVVGTIKALKLHGGAKEKELEQEDLGAVRQGLPNLLRHLENVKKFGCRRLWPSINLRVILNRSWNWWKKLVRTMG